MTDTIRELRKPSLKPDDLKVKVAKSKGHRGKVRNITQPWPGFIATLKEPARDSLTWAQYDKLSVDEKQVRKASAGYFVGGHFVDGLRQVGNISHHSLLTLDCDQPSKTQYQDFINPDDLMSVLAPFEYFVYTTRSHRKSDPRVRIVIPMLHELSNEEFAAAARILASRIDSTMMTVDPVSFRSAQVMYMPTCNADADFVTYHNPGKLLDGKADILDQFDGDWTDWEQLPRGERDTARPSGQATENAMEKRGWVGAYCRARPILDQLAGMPEIYAPADGNANSTRWSYLGGETSNGVVVYPSEGRMTTHHGSDPAGDRKSNTSFDVERAHFYAHFDGGVNLKETDPREWPSYKALIEALQTDERYKDVQQEYAKSVYDTDAMAEDGAFDEGLIEEGVEDGEDVELIDEDGQQKHITPGAVTAKTEIISDEADEFDIKAALDLTEKMAVRKTPYNTRLLVKHDKRLRGRFAYNEFLNKTVMVKRIRSKQLDILSPKIRNIGNGDDVAETTRMDVRVILSSKSKLAGTGDDRVGWGYAVGDDEVARVIDAVAKDNSFHPIKRYLEAVEWDGVCRLDTFFSTYFHTPQNVYYADVGRYLFVAGVARVYEPGCKYDSLVVVEGQQKCGKSSAVGILGVQPEWFGGFTADVSKNERVIENIVGKWMVEWPELSSFDKAETNQIKSIISAGKLSSRLAYERGTKDYLFQCVMIGTTNDQEYLKDRTGNRRYLPIKVPDGKRIDLPGLRRDIDQLWAEAVQVYRWMRRCLPVGELVLMVEGEAERIATILQGQKVIRGQEDDWFALIEEWLETPQNAALSRGELDDGAGDDERGLILPSRCSVASVAHHALNFPRGKALKPQNDMIARCLDRMPGFNRAPNPLRFRGFGRALAWERDDSEL